MRALSFWQIQHKFIRLCEESIFPVFNSNIFMELYFFFFFNNRGHLVGSFEFAS